MYLKIIQFHENVKIYLSLRGFDIANVGKGVKIAVRVPLDIKILECS